MATIRESDLSATFNRDFLKGLQALLEYIHHSDFVCETYNDMET
jgi:hypothetical protein